MVLFGCENIIIIITSKVTKILISKRSLWIDIFKTFGICYLKPVNILDF